MANINNPQTNFEQWLSETLANDPCYKFNIVCNYHDVCVVCPLYKYCEMGSNLSAALAHLESIAEGDNTNDN